MTQEGFIVVVKKAYEYRTFFDNHYMYQASQHHQGHGRIGFH